MIETQDSSIEFDIREADPVESFAFHVRGGFRAIVLIDLILQTLGVRALVPSDGGIFNLEDLRSAFDTWTTYRDQIVGDGNAK